MPKVDHNVTAYKNEFASARIWLPGHKNINGLKYAWSDTSPHQRLLFIKHIDGQFYLTQSLYCESGEPDMTYGVFPIGWYKFFWDECDRLQADPVLSVEFNSLISEVEQFMNYTNTNCRNYLGRLGDHRTDIPFFSTETDFAFAMVSSIRASFIKYCNRFKSIAHQQMMDEISFLNSNHEIGTLTYNTLIRIGLITFVTNLRKDRNEASIHKP